MAKKRKSHTGAFKAPVALAAVKGDKTVNELSGTQCERLELSRSSYYFEPARQQSQTLFHPAIGRYNKKVWGV